MHHRPLAPIAQFLNLPVVPGWYLSTPDYFTHRGKTAAIKHAGLLEKITGDCCRIIKLKETVYKVIRIDPSGKKV